MAHLTGKTALITGSTSGIGLAIAKALAEKGCDIMLNGLGDAKEIEQTRQAIKQEYQVKAFFNGADLTKSHEIEALIQDAHQRLGRLDILVNNAGIQYVNPVEKFDTIMWDKMVALNLSAVFHTTHHTVPIMKEQGWGRIINIASAHGLVASVHKAGYVACKHGVVGLTKVVGLETAQNDNVTVNAICPGFVYTELIKKQIEIIAERDGMSFEDAKKQLLVEKQPSLEFVQPEEVGALAVFLCQEEARQITGSSYSIDGGWTAQ